MRQRRIEGEETFSTNYFCFSFYSTLISSYLERGILGNPVISLYRMKTHFKRVMDRLSIGNTHFGSSWKYLMIFSSAFSLVPTQFIFLCKHRVSLRCSSSSFIHHWLSHSTLHLKTYWGFISASFSLKITLFDPYWPLTKFFNSLESASLWTTLPITLKTVLPTDVIFVILSLQHLQNFEFR